MTRKEIHGTKLIANFMKCRDVIVEGGEVYCHVDSPTEQLKKEFPRGLIRHIDYMDYNAIMPVVEAIEALNTNGTVKINNNTLFYAVNIWGKNCNVYFQSGFGNAGKKTMFCSSEAARATGKTKLEGIWLGVVAFIKWYNKYSGYEF